MIRSFGSEPRGHKQMGRGAGIPSGARRRPPKGARAAPDGAAPPTEAGNLRLLGEVAPGIMHDIRNMLGAVICGARVMRSNPAQDPRPVLDGIEAAGQSARDLVRILAQLLSLGTVPPPALIDVNARLRAMQGVLMRVLPPGMALDLLLARNLAPVLLSGVEFDAAVLNLVLNARDAMEATGGRITITTRNACPGDADGPAKAHVAISVRDDGPGMDRATLARASTPYFTTKGERGTGLGLHQVRRFANASGGWMRLRSSPGRGTVVRLLLPGADMPGQAAKPPPIQAAPSVPAVLATTAAPHAMPGPQG